MSERRESTYVQMGCRYGDSMIEKVVVGAVASRFYGR
jgi:hypothetical protein